MSGKWADHAVLKAGAAYERARSATLAEPTFERWTPPTSH
jgi:amidase